MGKGKFPKFANNLPSKHTFFTEVEGIDVCLKIVNLLELIHEKDLIYSNLCPEEIFLKDKSLGSLCFTSLYHCIGDALSSLGIEMPDQLTTCDFDARTRNQDYISPEQNVIAKELLQHGYAHNGKIDEKSLEVQEFIGNNRGKIT